MSEATTVADYFADLDPQQYKVLERVRNTILKLVPGVEEVMGYGIPTYKYKKKNLIHIAAFSHHMSIFPGPVAVAQMHDKLSDYTTSKGTIQFTVEEPLSEKLLTEIITICKNRLDAA